MFSTGLTQLELSFNTDKRWPVPNVPTHFYGTVCHVCRVFASENTELKTCSGCKLIAYCSPQHQKLHWPKHKQLCKSVQFFLQTKSLQHIFHLSKASIHWPQDEEWKCIRYNSMLIVELTMDRKLLQDEREMFFFPRVCQVCRDSVQKRLYDCVRCHCVSYCSTAHEMLDKERHDLFCPALNVCYRIENCMFSIDCNKYSIDSFIIPIQNEHELLPHDMELFLQRFFPSEDAERDIHIAFCSDILTCPLTLLYCIEKRLKDADAVASSSMVVHIVGASVVECSSIPVWEIILHWLPYLKDLKLILIGPEVIRKCDIIAKLCVNCEEDRKELSFNFQEGMLHQDYFKSSSFVKPDIVVAFNCGFHENQSTDNDTWAISIPLMLHYPKTTLMLTSYTLTEAKSDIDCVEQNLLVNQKVNVLMKCQNNPFRSKRPRRDCEQNGWDVFFFNAFVSMVLPLGLQ